MTLDHERIGRFIKPGPTDTRKQVSGLAVIAETEMEREPFSGNLFLFCVKTRKAIKALYRDRSGFCPWMKRLERNQFPWLRDESAAREVGRESPLLSLGGIDVWRERKSLSCTSVL